MRKWEIGEKHPSGPSLKLLNLLELAVDLAEEVEGRKTVTDRVLAEVLAQSWRRFDKGGDKLEDRRFPST